MTFESLGYWKMVSRNIIIIVCFHSFLTKISTNFVIYLSRMLTAKTNQIQYQCNKYLYHKIVRLILIIQWKCWIEVGFRTSITFYSGALAILKLKFFIWRPWIWILSENALKWLIMRLNDPEWPLVNTKCSCQCIKKHN